MERGRRTLARDLTKELSCTTRTNMQQQQPQRVQQRRDRRQGLHRLLRASCVVSASASCAFLVRASIPSA
jgi:hypothetical protein